MASPIGPEPENFPHRPCLTGPPLQVDLPAVPRGNDLPFRKVILQESEACILWYTVRRKCLWRASTRGRTCKHDSLQFHF
jgi:hypothetical protein